MKSEAYLMDCMDFMRQYPDKYFDLAIVDPPYGIGANKMQLGNGKRKIYRGENDWDNSIPTAEYWQELFRVSKNQIVWGGNYMTEFLPPSRCWVFWDKGTGDNSYADGELAWCSFDKVVKKFTKFWSGGNAKEKGDLDRVHPTQKPIALYEWIYHNYLPDGGKVIDTHLGSGSNRIAADKAGNIDFYATEIDPDYFADQEKRFRQYKSQLTFKF